MSHSSRPLLNVYGLKMKTSRVEALQNRLGCTVFLSGRSPSRTALSAPGSAPLVKSSVVSVLLLALIYSVQLVVYNVSVSSKSDDGIWTEPARPICRSLREFVDIVVCEFSGEAAEDRNLRLRLV